MGNTRIDRSYCTVFISIYIQGFVQFASVQFVVVCTDSFYVILLIIKFESWSIHLHTAILL